MISMVGLKKENLKKEMIEKINQIFTENETVKCYNSLDYGDKVLLLLEDKDIIGYCIYKYNDEPYKGVYINQVAIQKKNQNNGYGRYFYNYLLEKEKCNIYAHVCIDNTQSMKFHCKNEFIPIKVDIDENFYGVKNYTSLLMVRENPTNYNRK